MHNIHYQCEQMSIMHHSPDRLACCSVADRAVENCLLFRLATPEPGNTSSHLCNPPTWRTEDAYWPHTDTHPNTKNTYIPAPIVMANRHTILSKYTLMSHTNEYNKHNLPNIVSCNSFKPIDLLLCNLVQQTKSCHRTLNNTGLCLQTH